MSQRVLFAIVTLMSIISLVLIIITAVNPYIDIHFPSDITRACSFGLGQTYRSFMIDWIMGNCLFLSTSVHAALWAYQNT